VAGRSELPILVKLKKELAELQRELNVELPKELAAAAAHGDLSENAEYDAAKGRQEYVRSRIGQLATRIRELSMYDVASIPEGRVAYGSEVLVEDVDEGTQSTYEIVFPEEVDAGQGRISLSSPIGRALLNKEEGDEVEVITPQGRRSYQSLGLKTFRERGVTDGKG
jgi:transcription elongation factor GreA